MLQGFGNGGTRGKLKAAAAAFYTPTAAKESNPFLAAIQKSGDEVCVEVWPENWPAFSLMVRMQTQWLHSMNGPAGMNYASLFVLIDRMKLSDSESSELFDDMQTLEIAALNAMAEKGD